MAENIRGIQPTTKDTMNLTPEQLSKLSPEQIAAYVNAMSQAAAGAKGGKMTDVADGDIDAAMGLETGGLPPLPEGTYDCTILTCMKYLSADTGSGSIEMFRVELQVDKVIEAGPIRERCEPQDKNPPPGPVTAGEARRWACPTSGKKNNIRQLQRIGDLVQAALRFEPGSKLAETAVTADGKPIRWGAIVAEATSEANPLGVNKAKVRVTIARVVTQGGKGFAMYVPTFKKHPDTEPRTDNVVRSF